MEISPALLSKLLLFCTCLGAVTGSICDVFFLFCDLLKKKGARGIFAARFFGDLVAVLTVSLGVIVFCYYFNDGTIRGFCFIGAAAGFFVYRHTLSYPFCALLRTVFRILFKVLRIISTPFARFFEFLVKKIKKTLFYLVKVLEKVGSMVYNIIKYNYILSRSKKGFL